MEAQWKPGPTCCTATGLGARVARLGPARQADAAHPVEFSQLGETVPALIHESPAGSLQSDKRIDALAGLDSPWLTEENEDLAENLSAAAHLIHGSSEGRFGITYCPGVLTREEIESVGFEQPRKPHEHWHIDLSYVNIHGAFCYPCSILDGYSRSIVHWDVRPSMTEADVEITLQRALEKHPDARSRIVSDNGPQFVAKEFKEFIRISGITHVRTSPCYP